MHRDRLPTLSFGPSTFVDVLRHQAEHLADKHAFTFLVDGESEEIHLTYQALDRQARAIGAWLQSRRLAGERVLLLYPAGLDFIAALFGCFYAGAIAVTAYPPRPNRSLKRVQAIVADAGARVALTTGTVWQRIQPLLDQTPDLERLAWQATDELRTGIEDDWREPQIGSDSLAFLQYTSGSTGRPKGVMLTHANLLHNSALIGYGFEHTTELVGVFWLPSYHDMGLVGGILQPMYVGAPNILMAPMSFLQKPIRWLQAITRYGGTTSGGPNFAYEFCVRKIRAEEKADLDLSSWKVAFNGAEPIRADTLERFTEAFEPCGFRPEAFYPCFGLAEATLLVSGGQVKKKPVVRCFEAKSLENHRVVEVPPQRETGRAMVGCGSNLPDQKIVIVNLETLDRCDDGEIGEIWVRGPGIAEGYWKRPDETQQTFGAYTDDGEGPYLRTGDLGFLLEGELFVTGRIKDLIILRGLNHYPQDIEHTVETSHRALRHSCGAAFTIQDEGQTRLVVVQEIERRMHAHAEEAIPAIRREVSQEHDLYIDDIVLIKAGSVPKTSSGKIQRHQCHDAFYSGTLDEVARWPAKTTSAQPPAKAGSERTKASSASPPTAPSRSSRRTSTTAAGGNGRDNGASLPATDTTRNVELVLDIVRRVIPQRADDVMLESSLADLGLDSLQRIELQTSIEECFGGRFPDDVALELETLRQIVDAVGVYLGKEPTSLTTAEVSPERYRFEQFPEYVELRSKLDLLDADGVVNPFFQPHDGHTADTTRIAGQEFINFSSFNYTGTAGHPTVLQAAKDAIDRYGASVSASRLVSGEKVLHGELEQAIAEFCGTEAAIAFASGHATNVNTIGHLYGEGDLILYDALAHNSIVQGCKLSGARRRPFPHNNHQALDRMLADLRPLHRRVLIAIEGVYSMDGDIADLPRFVEVRKRHKVNLLVDEAHSAGVLGQHGRGIGEHFGVHPRDVDLWMGTLSKSLGSSGGYITGERAIVEYLKYTAPGFVFSTGISPAATAAALAAIQLIEDDPGRIARLHERARLFLDLAQEQGINTGLSSGTPIIPVIMGNSLDALRLGWGLSKRGINVQPILYPAVDESAARLRFFITSEHTEEQIRYTVKVLAEELERIDPKYLGRTFAADHPPASLEAVPPG